MLGDRYLNILGHQLGRPQSHRAYPELHFPLEIFTVGVREGAQKGRLQNVSGKYLKFFLLI